MEPAPSLTEQQASSLYRGAAAAGHAQVLRYLAGRFLQQPPTPEALTAAEQAISSTSSVQALRALYEPLLAVSPDSTDRQRILALVLRQATVHGMHGIPRKMLERGVLPESCDDLALWGASLVERHELLRALRKGEESTARGGQPLGLAHSRAEAARCLAKADADPDEQRRCALRLAVLDESWGEARELLAAGACVDGWWGGILLVYEAVRGTEADAHLLLDRYLASGCPVEVFRVAAADAAARRGQFGLLRRLLAGLFEPSPDIADTIQLCVLGDAAAARGQGEVLAELNALVQERGSLLHPFTLTALVAVASLRAGQINLVELQLGALLRKIGSERWYLQALARLLLGTIMRTAGPLLLGYSAGLTDRLPRWQLVGLVVWSCLPMLLARSAPYLARVALRHALVV